jgi:hypothetical protein
MKGWSGLNLLEWDETDLAATISEFQPADNYACCFAVQAEIVVIDIDISDLEHAEYAKRLADTVLGETPLLRIGCAPKCIRIYRPGEHVSSRKLHPLEIFSGSGQFIAFGWHEKAGRPYLWPDESPLTIAADDAGIPAISRAQLDQFSTELFEVVPRRLVPTKQNRPGGAPTTVAERLRMLTTLHGSWKRAAAIVLREAGEGYYNETLWAVVTSAAGRGIPEDVVWELVEKHFNCDPNVSDAKITADLTSMIERTRPAHRPSLMTFSLSGDRK